MHVLYYWSHCIGRALLQQHCDESYAFFGRPGQCASLPKCHNIDTHKTSALLLVACGIRRHDVSARALEISLDRAAILFAFWFIMTKHAVMSFRWALLLLSRIVRSASLMWKFRSRNSVVTRLRTRWYGVRNPARSRELFVLRIARIGSGGPTHSSIQWIPGLFPGVKAAGAWCWLFTSI